MDHIEEYHNRNSEKFKASYPELENIEIFLSRHDRYNDKGHKSIMPITKKGFFDGRYFQCSDENCTGKYDLSGYIKQAIQEKIEEFDVINKNCEGKLRGSRERYCERSTSFWVRLIYK